MRSFRACARALWAMSHPVRWRMGVSVLAGLVRIVASLSFVWVSKYLVDIATGAQDAPLGPAIGLFAAILFLQIAAMLFMRWWESYTQVKTQNVLRKELFSHVLSSRWDGRERFLSGDTVNRLEEDIRVVADIICSRLPGTAVTLLQLVAASVYLLVLAPRLFWVLILLMLVTVFGSKLFFRQLRQLMAAIRARESDVQQLMQESLLHRVLVLTLTRSESLLEKMGSWQADIEDDTRKRLNYNAVARGLMLLGFQLGHALAFLWGVIGILHGTVTYGMMTAFIQLVGQVQRPVAELAQQIPAFIQAVTSVERLMELDELEQEPAQTPITLPAAPEIAVKDLSYAYPGVVKPILSHFSCTFPAGQVTLIVGPTGAGKSTLLRLILGLLKPQEGEVTLSGHPAGSALLGNFQYVPQGNTLLSGTIRSNLLLASPEASEADLYQALELAMAGFVRELPEGLDTPTGESGSGLSEGQCQRIAVARALLRPGGILILDESTSALDEGTERQLLEHLHQACRGRKTVLVVSHRPAALAFADQVVNLKS